MHNLNGLMGTMKLINSIQRPFLNASRFAMSNNALSAIALVDNFKFQNVSPVYGELMKGMGLSHVYMMQKPLSAISATHLHEGLTWTKQDKLLRNNDFALRNLTGITPTLSSMSGLFKMAEAAVVNHHNIIANVKLIRDFDLPKIYSLQPVSAVDFAMVGFGKSLGTIKEIELKTQLFARFQSIQEKIDAVVEEFAQQQTLDEQWIERFKQVWVEVVELYEECKPVGRKVWKYAKIVATLAGLHLYIDWWLSPPVTQEQIEDLKTTIEQRATREQIDSVNTKIDSLQVSLNKILARERSVRYLISSSHVLLKPKRNSATLAILPENYEVVVLDSAHKWMLIRYKDPADNLTQTGWVPKKNLSTSK